MKNQEFATLKGIERLNGSINGNPNYRVILDSGNGECFTLRSSSDNSWCYGIDHSWIGKTVSYATTRNNRVNYMRLTTIEDTFTDKLLNNV